MRASDCGAGRGGVFSEVGAEAKAVDQALSEPSWVFRHQFSTGSWRVCPMRQTIPACGCSRPRPLPRGEAIGAGTGLAGLDAH